MAVATSFIDCLSHRVFEELEFSLLLSTEVKLNLDALGTDYSFFTSVSVVDFYGIGSVFLGVNRFFKGYDLIFTVFGPAYYLGISRALHLVGFAQPNIIYSVSTSSERRFSRYISRLKYKLQELFFVRADALVVELEHVRDALQKKKLFRALPIFVVYSAVHSIFLQRSKWQEVALPAGREGALKLGLISRNYAHKNLMILPRVKKLLLDRFGLAVDFFVTFTDSEWLD